MAWGVLVIVVMRERAVTVMIRLGKIKRKEKPPAAG